MIILTIIGLILVSIVLIFGFVSIEETNGETTQLVLFILFFVGGILLSISYTMKPSALDVYRHRTELKITYEGKTHVDTVVIFKNQRNEKN